MTALVRVPLEVATADGVVLRGVTCGNAPVTLVLVHETGVDLDAWGDAAERLASHGFEVLAFDLRGHGASDGEPSPERVVDDVSAVLDARDRGAVTAVVVAAGDSAAGATLAAARRRVAGLVLVSPAYPVPPELPERVVMSSLVIVDGSSRDGLDHAKAAQAAIGGWRMVIHAGTDTPGSAMFESDWGGHLHEHLRAFARQAMRSRGAG